MKTTNNAQKTVNGQMKTMCARAAVVACSLVLITWTVSAQDFLKDFFANAAYSKMIYTADASSAESIVGKPAAAVAESVETEKELEVEAWMLNDASFASTEINTVETEQSLGLEDWMTDTKSFSGSTNLSVEVEAEPALKVEAWMTEEANFTAPSDCDENLKLESWMVNDAVFTASNSTPLKIEAWMAQTQKWGY